MRVSAMVAMAAALSLCASAAFAFGAPRSGCTVNVSSAGASLQLEIYSEETGWPESPTERQTRQWEKKIVTARFGFPNTAPVPENTQRIDGYFTVNVAQDVGTNIPTSPWRDGWVIGGAEFSLAIPPDWEAEISEVEILARLETGDARLQNTHRFGYASYGMRGLTVRPSSTSDGTFAHAFESAQAMEVRALRADGTALGIAAFDLSQARTLSDELFARMPALLESYEFGTLIDSFDCNEDVEL